MMLGDSLQMAVRRWKQVKRRLAKTEENNKGYIKFKNDYVQLGPIVEVDPPSATSKFRYYVPYHFVK